MPIARVQAQTVLNGVGPNMAWFCASAPTPGNLLVLFMIGNVNGIGVNTAAGWTRPAFTNVVDSYGIFYRVAQAGDGSLITAGSFTSGSAAMIEVSVEYSGTLNDQATVLDVGSFGTYATTLKSTSGQTIDPADGVERLLLGFFGSDGSGRTFSAGRFNGSTTGVTAIVENGAGTSNGGMRVYMIEKFDLATVAGSYSADATASAADDGFAALYIFKPGATSVLTPPLIASGSTVYAPRLNFNGQISGGLATATAAAPTATLTGKTVFGAGVATATAASAAATITAIRSATLSAGVATATAAAPTAALMTYTPGVAAFRIGARASIVGVKAIQATTRLAGTGRLAVAGQHGGVQPAVLVGRASLAVAGRRGGLAVAALRGRVSIRPTAVPKASLGLTALRVRWRAAVVGTPLELPRATNGTVILFGRVSGAGLPALHAGTSEPSEFWTRLRTAVDGRHGAAGDVAGRVTPWAEVIGLKAVPGTVVVAASASSLSSAAGGHLGLVALRGAAIVDVAPGVRGALNTARFWADLSVALESVSDHPPPGPYDPLVPIDLGTLYRGDTMILPIWQAQNQRGFVIDLTGVYLRFTAKTDLASTDASAPTIQVSSDDGGFVILDAASGFYRVILQPGETQNLLDDTVFTFDVQLYANSANVYTIRRGLMTVARDVTRTPA